MPLKVSNRSDVESFRALENLRAVNERVARGEDIIRLEAGQPSFGAPQPALDHALAAIKNDPKQGYTEAVGMTLLRDRIAVGYRDEYGIDLDYKRIAVTTGSSCGFLLAFLAAFEAGDKVGVVTPTYAAYKNILKALDIKTVEIPATPETNYQPTVEMLDNLGEKIDGLIINSPGNPTGTIIAEKELKAICEWCEDNGVRLISDEAYHGITYEEKAQSALKYSRSAVVLNTFSKYYAMTGWRLGWLALPDDMIDRVKKLAENLFVAPPTISQQVAYKIFDHKDVLDEYVAHYRKNRDILKENLPRAGLDKLSSANGAFYIYADISHLSNNSEEFCRRLLNEAGVSATAGMDFDPGRGHTAIRISYAGDTQHMHEACRRIKEWLA